MGYTHYWDMNPKASKADIKRMVKFTKQAIKQLESEGIHIVGSAAETGTKPEVDAKSIRLNGLEEEGHETFSLSMATGESDYCKTNRKPYDALVLACLLHAAELKVITAWRSDGEAADGDFNEGQRLRFDTLAALGITCREEMHGR